jgi:hypothetical protein
MSWLVEDPTPTLVAIVLIEAVLAIALVKTGRGILLAVIAAVGLLGAGLLVLEWVVVTDAETVADTLTAAAQALEANDPQAVQQFIDPASPMRNRVASEMAHVTINKATFNRLDVRFNRRTSPPTAEADFMGYINGRDRRGEFPYENFAGRFIVRLRREGDRWVMTDYEMHDRSGPVR